MSCPSSPNAIYNGRIAEPSETVNFASLGFFRRPRATSPSPRPAPSRSIQLWQPSGCLGRGGSNASSLAHSSSVKRQPSSRTVRCRSFVATFSVMARIRAMASYMLNGIDSQCMTIVCSCNSEVPAAGRGHNGSCHRPDRVRDPATGRARRGDRRGRAPEGEPRAGARSPAGDACAGYLGRGGHRGWRVAAFDAGWVQQVTEVRRRARCFAAGGAGAQSARCAAG